MSTTAIAIAIKRRRRRTTTTTTTTWTIAMDLVDNAVLHHFRINQFKVIE
jgi:hypothetical protein